MPRASLIHWPPSRPVMSSHVLQQPPNRLGARPCAPTCQDDMGKPTPRAPTVCPYTSVCPNPVACVTHTWPPCPATVSLTTALLRAPTPWEMKERGEGVSGSPPHIPASSRDPPSPGHATWPPPSIFPFGWPPHGFTACLHVPGDTDKRGGRHQATLATLQRPRSHLPPSRVHQHRHAPPHLHLHLRQMTHASVLDVM